MLKKISIGIHLNSNQEALLGASVQFLPYLLQAQCERKCIYQRLPNVSDPDPTILDMFKKRVPYSYLQFSYYQVSAYNTYNLSYSKLY